MPGSLGEGTGGYQGAGVGGDRLVNRGGHRRRADAAGPRRDRLGMGPGDRVATDDEIDTVEAGRVVARGDRDAELGEQRARRRIDVFVGTGHAVTALAEKTRQGAHADAARRDQMYSHRSSASITASCTRGRTSRMRSLSRFG